MKAIITSKRVSEEDFEIFSNFKFLLPYDTYHYNLDWTYRYDVADHNLCFVFNTSLIAVSPKFAFYETQSHFGRVTKYLSFENFLDKLSKEIQEELLFHLDIFI